MKTLMVVNIGCAFVLVISGWLLAGRFLALLMGPEFAAQSQSTLQWLVVACFFQGIQVVPHFILMATGDLTFLAVTSMAGLGVTLVVMMTAMPSFGLAGAVLGRMAGGAVQCVLFPRVATFFRRAGRSERVSITVDGVDGAEEPVR